MRLPNNTFALTGNDFSIITLTTPNTRHQTIGVGRIISQGIGVLPGDSIVVNAQTTNRFLLSYFVNDIANLNNTYITNLPVLHNALASNTTTPKRELGLFSPL